jgi:hypothetical protein
MRSAYINTKSRLASLWLRMETLFGTRRLTVIGPDWHQATVPANVFHLSLKRLPMAFWSSSAVYFEH